MRAKSVAGFHLLGSDGELGTVTDLLFDDLHWGVRYLVANTGTWLTERQVLIAPNAIKGINANDDQILLGLTKKQIEDSPSLETDKPVSRQFEDAYHRYFGWPVYWGMPIKSGGYFPFLMTGSTPEREEEQGDPHLRSIDTIDGYEVLARDGEVGNVVDFIIDDETWAIRYLVVDTGVWWPGKKVLISPRWIQYVGWTDAKVHVDQSRETIKEAPEYTDRSFVTRDYEIDLHRYYDRQAHSAKGSEKLGRPVG